MRIEFDSVKRAETLRKRGLDMERADEIFDAEVLTVEDLRVDYGESRFFTIGYLDDRRVALIWTPRGSARRIISLRKANEREQAQHDPPA